MSIKYESRNHKIEFIDEPENYMTIGCNVIVDGVPRFGSVRWNDDENPLSDTQHAAIMDYIYAETSYFTDEGE